MQQAIKIIYSSRCGGTLPLHWFIWNRWSHKHPCMFPGQRVGGYYNVR